LAVKALGSVHRVLAWVLTPFLAVVLLFVAALVVLFAPPVAWLVVVAALLAWVLARAVRGLGRWVGSLS
jgi:hypothetical protein